MTCRCGETARAEAKHSFKRTVGGRTFTAEAVVDGCARCGEPNVPAALVIGFERAIAADLARRGPASGETFRWIRKAAAIDRAELGRFLCVPAETVAAWEEERRAIDVAVWTLVASLVLDGIEGPRSLRSRVRRQREAASGTVHLEIDARGVGTVRRALALLTAPIVLREEDVADALDVDASALRACLHDLAGRGLLRREPDDAAAAEWRPLLEDGPSLFERAEAAGVDLDAPLPRAKPLKAGALVERRRVTPMAWRAV